MRSSGTSIDAYAFIGMVCGAGELVVEYTSSKLMIGLLFASVELKQFSFVTRGTSSGSAKVMSAHCGVVRQVRFLYYRVGG